MSKSNIITESVKKLGIIHGAELWEEKIEKMSVRESKSSKKALT